MHCTYPVVSSYFVLQRSVNLNANKMYSMPQSHVDVDDDEDDGDDCNDSDDGDGDDNDDTSNGNRLTISL